MILQQIEFILTKESWAVLAKLHYTLCVETLEAFGADTLLV